MTISEAVKLLAIEEQRITQKIVKAAYRSLISKWHPDRHSGEENVKNATAMAQRVNLAYEVLSDSLEVSDFIPNPLTENSPPNHKAGPKPRTRNQNTYSTPRSTPRSSQCKRFWRDVVEHEFPDESVFEVFFESSHLVSAGYDPISRILYQKFLQGGGDTVVYRYFDVTLNVWNKLLSAPSHGSYAYKNINYSFRYEICSEPNRPYNPKWRFSAENYTSNLYSKAQLVESFMGSVNDS